MALQYTLDIETSSKDDSIIYKKLSTTVEFSDNKEIDREALNFEHLTIKARLKHYPMWTWMTMMNRCLLVSDILVTVNHHVVDKLLQLSMICWTLISCVIILRVY